MSSLRKGELVAFDFTIEPVVQGRRGERRTGVGVVADNEVNYACWPPGRSIRVTASDDYKDGTVIAVATHNLKRIGT